MRSLRLGRRGGGAGLALTGLAALVMSSCIGAGNPDGSTSTSTTAGTTTAPPATTTTVDPALLKPYGGEAVLAVYREPVTLNPFLPGGSEPAARRIGQTYLGGVYDISASTLELIPELVTELPTTANGGVEVNPDGTMTVVYEIRPEARWSDGRPVTGDDFEFTLETILDRDLPIDRAAYEGIISSEAAAGSFRITLTAPTIEYELLFPTIIPKHAVEGTDFAADWNREMWPSAGPFVLDGWDTGSSLRVVRNEQYWREDPVSGQTLPYLDGISFVFLADTTSQLSAFRSRDIDAIRIPSDVDVIESVLSLDGRGAEVQVEPGPVWEHLNFQFGPGRLERNENSCNESLDMRRAIAHAVDRDGLAGDLWAGLAEPIDSYVTPFDPGRSNDNWSIYDVDPAMAGSLYQQAVAEVDVPCSVVFTTALGNDRRVRTSELLAPMFDAAGIPFRSELEDGALFFGDTVDQGRWDVGEWAWQGSPGLWNLVRFLSIFDPRTPPPSGSNYYRWGTEDSSVVDSSTERYAEILDELETEVDVGEVTALLAEAEAILADGLVLLPLHARPSVAAVWSDELAGYRHNTSRAEDTWNAHEWYRADLVVASAVDD